nr:MAG TPA: hypothetical protein [Caudoviricetes sp.]
MFIKCITSYVCRFTNSCHIFNYSLNNFKYIYYI